MNLEITKYNNFFKVKGALVKKNVPRFQDEFHNVFENANTITLNLEDLVHIDRFGINAIAKLHNEAISKKKKLAIIGSGNNKLLTHFKSLQVA